MYSDLFGNESAGGRTASPIKEVDEEECSGN
jgi:hypothetical protein